MNEELFQETGPHCEPCGNYKFGPVGLCQTCAWGRYEHTDEARVERATNNTSTLDETEMTR